MNQHPIVFVHGLLGWGRDKLGGLPYFGMAGASIWLARVTAAGRRWPRALFPSVGPISSNHDRACELFHQIKGGDVCYGDAHSREHGHGNTVPGWREGQRPLFPEWDADHPLHFVGQAQGASTVRLLQHLLAHGSFFQNSASGRSYETSAAWIRSVTTISAIHNGTPAAYVLGCSPADGRIEPRSTAEYLIHTLLEGWRRGTLSGFLKRHFYDLQLSQWTDFDRFVRGQDNAAYDLSIHGAQVLDAIEDHDCTYYLSFMTANTKPEPGTQYQVPQDGMNLAFHYVGTELGRFNGPLSGLKYPIASFEEWWRNDGLAPTCMQEFPRWGTQRVPARPAPGGQLRPGVWNVMETLDMDHMEIVALPHLSITLSDQRRQFEFYKRLHRLLASLD